PLAAAPAAAAMPVPAAAAVVGVAAAAALAAAGGQVAVAAPPLFAAAPPGVKVAAVMTPLPSMVSVIGLFWPSRLLQPRAVKPSLARPARNVNRFVAAAGSGEVALANSCMSLLKMRCTPIGFWNMFWQ